MIGYILIGQTPVPVDDVLEWARWWEQNDRVVFQEEISAGVLVSTVFLGLDHNFSGKGPPLLFETMIFRDGKGDEEWRWHTWLEAEEGHRRVVETLKAVKHEKDN